MTSQQPPINLEVASDSQCATLLLTTTSTADIDKIEHRFNSILRRNPELRKALFDSVRQVAAYRRTSTGEVIPDTALSAREGHAITDQPITQLLEQLQATNDPRVIAFIELWTIDRLHRLPEARTLLFDIARQGATYRATQPPV